MASRRWPDGAALRAAFSRPTFRQNFLTLRTPLEIGSPAIRPASAATLWIVAADEQTCHGELRPRIALNRLNDDVAWTPMKWEDR